MTKISAYGFDRNLLFAGKLEIELRELENSTETQKNKENMHVKKSTNKKKAKV